MTNTQELVVWINFSIYTILVVFYLINKKAFNLSSLVLLVYCISSFFGILFYHSPLSNFTRLQIFPALFLFSLFLLVVTPLFKFDNKILDKIIYPKEIIWGLSIILGVLSIIPSIEVTLLLMKVSKMDNSIYSEIHRLKNSGEASLKDLELSQISKIQYIIISRFSDISPILLFIQLASPKKKWIAIILIFLSIYCVNGMGIVQAGRSELTFSVMYFTALYLIFKPFFSPKTNKIVVTYGLSTLLIILAIFFFITISRFNTKSTSINLSLIDWFSLYAGEGMLYFNEYIWNMEGTTEGDYGFSYFKQFLDYNTFIDVVERRNYWASKTRIPQQVFYTFLGNIIEDFGKILGSIFLIIVTLLVLNFTKIRNRKFSFSNLIVLCLWSRILLLGITFYSYSGQNNSQVLIVDLVLAFICSINKQNAFISRFSIK